MLQGNGYTQPPTTHNTLNIQRHTKHSTHPQSCKEYCEAAGKPHEPLLDMTCSNHGFSNAAASGVKILNKMLAAMWEMEKNGADDLTPPLLEDNVCICGSKPMGAPSLTERRLAEWLRCDYCHGWFHFTCVSLKPNKAPAEMVWKCPLCRQKISSEPKTRGKPQEN